MQVKIYLYDFKFYKDKDLVLFGYMESASSPGNELKVPQWRKVELLVRNYKIALQVNVDCNLFYTRGSNNESHDMVENYLYVQNKALRDLVKSYRQLDDFLPFKGAQTPENNQKIVEFEFDDFKSYEQFGRKINELNEKVVNEFKAGEKNNMDYVDRLILKEKTHMTEFLKKELGRHASGSKEYLYVQELIANYQKNPDKGTNFLELEQQRALKEASTLVPSRRLDIVPGSKVEIIENLVNSYHYSIEMVKYPFRMMEDDSKSNYILKLIRQSKCQLAGFNLVTLSSPEFEVPEDPSKRIQLQCTSIDDIVFQEDLALENKIYANCPLTLLCWDIEVCTESGKFDNDGKNPLNKVLCIGLSFGYIQAPGGQSKRINVCVTWVDSADEQLSLEDFTSKYIGTIKANTLFVGDCEHVIRTPDEMSMIHAFFYLVNLFDPSFITGFNDYQFDFPFIRDKLSTFSAQNGKLKAIELLYRGFFTQLPQISKQPNGQTKVVKKSFMGDIWCSQTIKINASDQRCGLSMDVMGVISIDTRILLMKTQKLEKKSLNDYLEANNLKPKLDVSFRDMNRAFHTLTQSSASDQMTSSQAKQVMQEVFKYCMYDSEACYLLWNKRNILPQSIEVSKLSYTPLKYSFLNADGIKVRNMVAKFAHEKKFSVPMTTRSQDIRLRDIELLNKYEKYPGAYVSPPKKGISATPVSALDFNSLYPSIIMAHNLSPEKIVEPLEVIGSGIKTFKIEIPFTKGDQSQILSGDVLTRDHQPGVYPEILEFLFASRKQVKAAMEALEEQADHTADPQQKKELQFQATLLNCKQLAIKVFMNTFYGETGNQKSPLFDVIISGGTTTMGQKYIKQVHHYIENSDCEIIYGDTDSVYFRPRLSHFRQYQQNNPEQAQQLSLQSQLLASAYEATERLKSAINTFIGDQTSNFLKMAFEELLQPSMFTGKKKYCGVVYVPGKMAVKQTLTIKDILLRGIDFIKSQYPDIIKQFGRETLISIMEHFMNQSKTLDNHQLEELFADNYRDNLNLQLKDLIQTQIVRLSNRLNTIQPEEYGLLSSKKKLRSAKTGQMMLFRQRFTDISDVMYNFVFSSVKDFALQIDVQQLQINNIAVPEDGEILDLVSIKAPSILQKLKASDLIHLLQYVKQRQIPINVEDYLKMFRTTASRILVSSFFDQCASQTELSTEEAEMHEKLALKAAKVFCDNVSKPLLQQHAVPHSTQSQDPDVLSILKTMQDKSQCLDAIISRARGLVTQLQLGTDRQQDILDTIQRQIIINPGLKRVLYVLLQREGIEDKLSLIQEQCGFQPQLESYQREIVSGLKRILSTFQEFQVLSLVVRVLSLMKLNQVSLQSEFVYKTLAVLIETQEWHLHCADLKKYVEVNKKLPPEMSESQTWLFKQRLSYIEKLKQQTKKTDNTPLMEESLISSSQEVSDFFADSIWDFNYQLFKKDQIASKLWINLQVQLFKAGKLPNSKILKIQKINPDILV